MDAFLARLSYHATSYAVRSCIALTSTYVINQGAKLLKTVDHDPLRVELGQLQRRLARKIELVSPILESIELRYTRGDAALETVVRTARRLQVDIDALGERLKNATAAQTSPAKAARDSKAAAARRQAELFEIIGDIKDLIASIDDAIPLINLWVSAIGGIQASSSSFSPSRLLQASMLVTVGDSQFILNPSQPMQIGPDFTLSLYMLFRGHASSHGAQEPYGFEEGQRKPMWQEVMHKARVRLLRIPLDDAPNGTAGGLRAHYAYQLQMVEDLDDGLLHTFDDKDSRPTPYDGISLAGIRESIPIHQISKMFYADVGKILNINNDDGASSSPVLLLKRDVDAMFVETIPPIHTSDHPVLAIEPTGDSDKSTTPPSEADSQDGVDFQLRQEMGLISEPVCPTQISPSSQMLSAHRNWSIPQDLDPEWIALEVFDIDEDEGHSDADSESDATGDEKQQTPGDDGTPDLDKSCHPRHTIRPSVDRNLITQLNRMNIASTSYSSPDKPGADQPTTLNPNFSSTENTPSKNARPSSTYLTPTKLIERSPFGAIKTSLSLLEMLLRLTSLQEFEQTTHLAIPDHVLKFYLDESVSSSGLHGKARLAASAEAERKVGFDPYADQTA
ncbi:RanGTP-binding protein-domain-containing protein [Xylaria intraflava]|nr:RanGTP-binding protein-domain-containing protein [Xylaria intraflava]